ncbi:RNA-binding S4 domain-containing protein [Mycoplasma sp. CSL7475-4]|uniref:RNA-binding S4 domain-containing protein n=1 Tax=Mycoplasma sp. CSL7475-4 TaxID=2973942 RepID=UPI00216B3176|nr:RNA-binding S4 domain-containing protein [Mycoplasma sp. CSL7475-4]MCS4536616.1 RNA-binding S4 domain-containing protein [Mycoplasma sp. CSL7475-4]
MIKNIYINTEFITLGQLLKLVGLISTGSEAKYFIGDNLNRIRINGKHPQGRGTKIYPGMAVTIISTIYYIKKQEN